MFAVAGPLLVVAAARLSGHPALVVHGASMGESIPRGSIAVGSWVDGESIGVGDVIMVHGEGTPFIHRVMDIRYDANEFHAVTQGDANAKVDPTPFTLSGRVLRVAWSLPFLGYLVDLMTHKAMQVLLVLALPGFFLLGVFRRELDAGPEPEGGKA
jgi:signal peptidase I